MSAHASHALNGSTSSFPLFTNQSSGPFRPVGGATTASLFCSSANAASCASCGCTSASPSFANQSSGPFGPAVGATNASPFGQSSSRFTGFGVGGPTTADNSCGGTRAPYRPTRAEETDYARISHINSISAMNCYCNKNHEELRLEDYKQTRNGGLSSAAHVPGVSNPFPVSSRNPFETVTWLPPLSENEIAFLNRYSENPIQRTDPSTSLGSDKNRTTPVQTSPVVQTSVAKTNPVVTTSHVSPSAVGVLGGQSKSALPPTPTNTSALFDFFSPVIKDPSLIPKGLEMIVEHLGFNPWEGKNNLKDSQATGHIILCKNASDNPDILSLAEFAVEQHNAMHQDGKVELLEVTAACLEAVDGGSRYHIILQAEPPASFIVHPTCFYAAVFRKNTNRPTPLIVLERWLYSRWSFRSSSSYSRSFK